MNKAGGIESLFIVYWSDVLTTDGSGNASGTIDITEAFPLNTSYIFTAHYGYDVIKKEATHQNPLNLFGILLLFH